MFFLWIKKPREAQRSNQSKNTQAVGVDSDVEKVQALVCGLQWRRRARGRGGNG